MVRYTGNLAFPSRCQPGWTVSPRNTTAVKLLREVPGPLPSTQTPPVFGAEPGGCSVTHRVPGSPPCPQCCGFLACPTPLCTVPHLGLKWVGFTRRGVLHSGPQGCGGEAGPEDKESGLGRGTGPTQRRQWFCVQASPRHTVGSCSQTAPRGESRQHLCSADPLSAGRDRSPGRAWLPGATYHLSHSGWAIKTAHPGPSPTRRPPNGHPEVQEKVLPMASQMLRVGAEPSKGTRNRGAPQVLHLQAAQDKGRARDEGPRWG